MLKTLDILIGATIIVLIFALAVTVLTQVITSMLSRRGEHLLDGLASLLLQVGITKPEFATSIANAVLRHPLVSQGKGWKGELRLGTVIHREELTKLLMEAASDSSSGPSSPPAGVAGGPATLWPTLDAAAKADLVAVLKQSGIADPAGTLQQVRMAAMQLEGARPELATDVRESMAILEKAGSDYVARVNSWFDQTIDRVSQQFAKHTHTVTVCLATIVVLAVQLDLIAVVNRLSVDDTLRASIVNRAISDAEKQQNKDQNKPPAPPATAPPSTGTGNSTGSPSNQVDFRNQGYYDALGEAGLIAFPLGGHWWQQLSLRKVPGMLLAILLVSLGAPFWYNVLKDLLGLRSTLAKNDDEQRKIRQTTQS